MDAPGANAGGNPSSQEVSWWATHEFITELVAHTANLPAAGTPAWSALSDDNPTKLIALAVAGEHHVLRVETAQIAAAEASRDIAEANDWSVQANRLRGRSGPAYIKRKGAA